MICRARPGEGREDRKYLVRFLFTDELGVVHSGDVIWSALVAVFSMFVE